MNDGLMMGPLLDLDDCYEYETGAAQFLVNSTSEERIKVDRRTLENMIQDPANSISAATESAADFFQRVMDETSTQIIWPSKLKVGAKSKKDPHIKIYGEPDAIQNAKVKILEIFDIKKNKVTMKMDVSYTDHSHVIGKGGHTIQQVMDDTGCHIHFPDSNRNTNAEKSNQVSIAGPAVGVEKARCRIRGLLPLVLTFEIPHPIPDFSSSAIIQMIFQSFGFMATSRPLRGGGHLVMVRGSCRQLASVQQGVSLLMNYLASNGMLPPVTLRTEIAPQHHAFVLGPLGCNVKLIMRTTGCSIMFPDPSAPPCVMYPGYPTATKSTVAITGKFDAVYTAWQLLIGYLPLVMMFDLREGQDIPEVAVGQLMDQYKVYISIRPKRKENIKTVMVRGPEHSSRALFEVRRQLLELDDSEVPTCCDRHAAGNPLATYLSQMALLTSSQQLHPGGPGGWPLPYPPPAANPTLLSLLLALETPHPTPKFSPWEHESSSSSGFSTPNLSPRHSPLHFHQSGGGLHCPLPSAATTLRAEGGGVNFRPQWPPEPADDKFLSDIPGSRNLLTSNFKDSASLGYGSMTDLNDFPESSIKPPTILDYDDKKLLATKAMQKPIGSEARSPTGVWSGCGFSRSLPEAGWGREWAGGGSHQGVFGLSNQFEGILGRPALGEQPDLPQALARAGLAKYIDAFLNADVDLDTFLTMTDSDFQGINIPFGARRKMMLLQHELCSKKTFQAAPGAERRKLLTEDNQLRW